jgi:predicted Zn-dependent protease
MSRWSVIVFANITVPVVNPSVTVLPRLKISMSWPIQRPLPFAMKARTSEGAVPLSPM